MIDRERIERAARIYANNNDAGAALGIRGASFARLCRAYDIQTPSERRQHRRQQERNEWRYATS